MPLTTVRTAGLADDAVTSAKIPADAVTNSELNLGSDYAFTGTVSGAGLSSPFASSVAITAEGGTATTNIAQGSAKAWLKFAATTPAITDSFNISSASDVGSGEATHVFTNNMANNKFVVLGMGGYSDFVQSGGAGNTSRSNATPDSTSTVTILNSNYNFTRVDTANMNSAEFGDLA